MKKPVMFNGKPMGIKRLLAFFVGLYVMCIGIGFAIHSNLGVSPVTTLPYVCGRILGVSVGIGTDVAFLVFYLIQVLVYRKHFRATMLLQLPLAFIFGYFTDSAKTLVGLLGEPHGLIMQLLWCIIGIVVLALGLYLYLPADVSAIPSDGVPVSFAWLTGKKLGSVKRIFDLCCVVISLTLSLIFMHDYEGLWIGTILAAFGVGTMLNVFRRIFGSAINVFIYGKEPAKGAEPAPAKPAA